MSLYLGPVGRKILKYTVSHPRLNGVVDHLSNTAHKVLGNRFIPGLSRALFLLSQKIKPGEQLTIRKDGIYREQEKLSPNPLGRYFQTSLNIVFDSRKPERIIKYFRCLKTLILDYSQRIGDPWSYILYALPKLLEKCKSIEELREAKALILDYSQRFGEDPRGYVRDALPKLLERCKSIEELREAKALILDYSQRFGEDPRGYIRDALPKLLERCKSIEELREAKTLILDYSQRIGDPWSYVLYALPKLLERCKSIEELRDWNREAKALILDYSQRIGDPKGYIRDALPKLFEQCKSEELRKAVKIAQGLIAVSVNPSPLADILNKTTDRSILYETHRKEFLRFCKNSGPNLPNNLGFFELLTGQNAKELFAASVDYFQAMKTSLLLPLFFQEYCRRDAEGRQKLANDFKQYCAAQTKGEKVLASELSADIREEIDYSLINSASLTKETYGNTLERLKGQTIPSPNFSQVITISLQKAQKKGSIPPKDVEYLKEKISWLEETLQLKETFPDLTSIESAIASFPITDRPGRKPSEKHTLNLIKLYLLKTYLSDENIKTKIDDLIARKESISAGDLDIPECLIEIFGEIKPDAEEEVKKRINGAVDVPRLEKIQRRFTSERSKEEILLELISSKTELDYFYGYMGENCTSGYPEELLNPAFTPMRIVVNGKIMGCIHTLTLDINGKKTLVLPGIEPKESLLAIIDAREFANAVISQIVEEICKPNGYDQLCLTTQSSSQSNRPAEADAIKEIIKDKRKITQEVQSNFPRDSSYSIEQLAVVWEK